MSLLKEKRLSDGYVLRCKSPCTNSISVRENTWFFKSKLALSKIIKLLYKYIAAEEYCDIVWEFNIDKDTSSSWGSLVTKALHFIWKNAVRC